MRLAGDLLRHSSRVRQSSSSHRLISRRCSRAHTIRNANAAIRVSGERFADEPEKNQYSHICEAFENLLLGGGEGKAVTMGSAPVKAIKIAQPRRSLRRVIA